MGFLQHKAMDMKNGFNGEMEVMPIYNDFFNVRFFKSKDNFSTFDFYCSEERIAIEHKTRNIKHDAFNSLMMGYNKYTEGRKLMESGWRVFFSWLCKDGLFFYEIPYELDMSIVVDHNFVKYNRGKRERSAVMYIPTAMIEKVDDFENYKEYMESK